MTLATLGRLKKVELRTVWEREDTGFTMWLSRPENLELLSQTLDLDLQYEAHEQNVGPYRADIVCTDDDGNKVLIENQLEVTDHTHLGQLLTYAGTLNTVTIIWIAARFTDEHRAALDWLNNNTGPNINFFGLEIEVWQIGNSAPAPKFNVVSQPNNWTKRMVGSRGSEITATKQLQFDYWTAMREHFLQQNAVLRPQKPLPQHWMNFAAGRSHFHYFAYANIRDKCIGLGLVISGPDRWAHYYQLLSQKEAIEAEAQMQFEWRALETKKESQVLLEHPSFNPADQGSWAAQHQWLMGTAALFQRIFSERIRQLRAADWAGNASEVLSEAPAEV
ncbi:DUF4268 domain-containing protein [Deinococcus cellulosilyticus]|uniref:DUF4268 domain-containing protein n=1 Tax=Deinococcus cellulosilyticus (strain DSM 18568 / NBRC 106333 / KACC 11606 / 5516J-15) TaxID=1223518 RepID=A0A511NAQ5_DEIC1|nr:DUF4268 domain-containing protein [Deinococcus cellulosilyticus]GEM49626.1 hypothetical protein DC3_52610 [Deinococcus cellulosilyticus NBRC 106333 = KACC 11606]